MRKRAKILLAGTLIATTSCAGVATSQTLPSSVDNQQLQLGDVFADQTLNVDDGSGQTTVVTTATGNAVSAAVETGQMSLTSTQSMQGNAAATATLTATASAGDPVVVVTEAVGNTGDASASGASMTAAVNQSTTGASVTADTTVDAPLGRVGPGGASVSTNAIANSQAFGVVDGRSDATVSQDNSALVQARTGATVQYMPGPATFASSAVANNVSSSGSGPATQTLDVTQTMTGARTQASTFIGTGNAWNVTGVSTAVANNVAVSNDGGSVDTKVSQTNGTYVRSETVLGAYEYGSASAQAYGVANSVSVGGETGYAVIDTTQVASGGVEVISDLTVHDGYDAYSTATATGNAVTGYACAECSATLSATNRQTNNSDVSATSSVSVGGPGRNTTATAVATGNSATFYVTRPGG
jgi:hypothetical protein